MDDTDSLFEGMVLFNPNSSFLEEDKEEVLPEPPPKQNQQRPHDNHHRDEIAADDVPEAPPISLDTASSEPLDESLFSDLTITTTATTTAIDSDSVTENETNVSGFSRQTSRKKKRASLRIGYGRDSSAAVATSTATTATADEQEEDGEKSDRSRVSVDEDNDNDGDEVKLGKIRARIAEKLESARGSAAAASEARKEAVARRRGAAETLRVASEAQAELERLLDEACESEDFEAAERLSDALAAADAERVSLVTALRLVEAQCDSAEVMMETVLGSQIAAEEECASMLEAFAKDASRTADLVVMTAQEVFSKQMEQLNSSTEAVELRRMELEIESQIVSEARAGLNTSIEHLVEDDLKERESLCKRKNVLVEELQKLLLLVKQKEDEIAETDSNIEKVDKKVTGVVSGFQEMQSEIESKMGNLESGLSEIEVESRELSEKKKEIDEVNAREEEKVAKLRELASASAEEAETYLEVVGLRKNLMVSVLKSREDKVRLAKTEEKLSDEVQMLQQVISTSRASLQELSTRKSSIQQDVATSKQKLLFIEKRIPELEAEKKVAASARNFKEAARIAAEAKSLTVEKDSVQVDIGKANSDLEKLEAEIKDTVEKLQETESLVSSKEKDLAMARFERLILIAGFAKAERAAALELGNQEEADLLLTEAELADSEAKALQPVYEFKVEEFRNIPKHFISMELVANLGKKQLEELSELVQFSRD